METRDERVKAIVQQIERLVSEHQSDAVPVEGMRLSYQGLGPISRALEGTPTPNAVMINWVHIADEIAERLEAGPEEVVVRGYVHTGNFYRPTLTYAYRDTKFPNVRIHIIRGYTIEGDLSPVVFVSVKNPWIAGINP